MLRRTTPPNGRDLPTPDDVRREGALCALVTGRIAARSPPAEPDETGRMADGAGDG